MRTMGRGVADRDKQGTTLVGRTIAGRYELCAPLAYGGMGTVFRGWDHQRDRSIAVKMLSISNAPDYHHGQNSPPWWWEAWVMNAVRHPHMVKVYDTTRDDDHGYIVMEWIEGSNLKRHIARAGPLDYREALDIGIQICRALQALHARGLIHRDVKPHNILRTPAGWVKLADFGIAQYIRSYARCAGPPTSTPRTTLDPPSSVLIGTATYCSPEQARGLPLTVATDIYSLGVVLYELLAGTPPFVAETPLAVATLHAIAPVPPLRHIRHDLPPLVERAVMQALAKDPARRFTAARAMGAALEYVETTVVSSNAAPLIGPPHRVSPGAPHSTRRPSYTPATENATATKSVGARQVSDAAGRQRYIRLHAFMAGTQRSDASAANDVNDAFFEYPTVLLARRTTGRNSPEAAHSQGQCGEDESETLQTIPPDTRQPKSHTTTDLSTVALCVADAVALLLFVLLLVWVH